VRICIVGKFPPIQGGVSMRTYWAAHALAMRGHDVHVVTNAKEVRPPYRMHMRPQDWERCGAAYGDGSVTVHFTDPVDFSQSYIPMASPFVSKLAGIAARLHSERRFDVIYSHYLEPYGVAAHLVSQITGSPHVARLAGSDAGRLWRHPQLEPLYDHVLRTAEIVFAAGVVAERAARRGVNPNRIVSADGGVVVPDDVFAPEGPTLDLAALRAEVAADPDLRELLWGDFAGDKPYFGICGKLDEYKGSFALLAAMHRLKLASLEVGLVALAHGPPAVEQSFRAHARKLGLVDRILQIPFLPHWRVPEFLRGCLAVCCLEQDFPIVFHTPIVAREVLLCGACLVGSTEVIRKLPRYERLVHGYGCVAIENVNDVDELTGRLAAIVQDPTPAAAVGARGRRFARDLQRKMSVAETLERVLEAAASRRRTRSGIRSSADAPAAMQGDRFFLTQLAAAASADTARSGDIGPAAGPGSISDLPRAREILATVERRIGQGERRLQPLVPAIEIEIAIAAAEQEEAPSIPAAGGDPLFRLHTARWALAADDLGELVPLRDPRLRVLKFDYDVSEFMQARSVADLPTSPTPRPSYILAFACPDGERRNPLVVDAITAQILTLSDGTRTVAEVVGALKNQDRHSTESDRLGWMEGLFGEHGLISLHDKRLAVAPRAPPDGAVAGSHHSSSPGTHRSTRARETPRSRS
jgi:glycosyltransferase involved in cell wall biosynthesis